MSELNAQLFQAPPSLLDLAKDSAAVAAHMASIAFEADRNNMDNLRQIFAGLAESFAHNSRLLLDACAELEKKGKAEKAAATH